MVNLHPGRVRTARDGIADALGISDGPNAGHTWAVDQERSHKGDMDRYAVRVSIEAKEDKP
jgi:hypothetical protein